MNLVKAIIMLGLAGSVFCGGDSNCGTIQQETIQLLQLFESIINGVASLVNNTVTFWPFIGNSNLENYFCTVNAATFVFAKGISEISGVNIDYMLGIFNGSISKPFLEPLGCISDEILSYYSLIQNYNTFLVPEWKSLVQKAPIDENTPCSTVLQVVTPYYQRNIQVATQGTNIAIKRAAIFREIGKVSLYLDYQKPIRICGTNATKNILAEILNINAEIVSEFLANQTISVPPPLSCVKGLFSSYSDTVFSTYDTINNTILATSPSPNCEPLFTQFMDFEGFWFKYLNELRNYAINQSVAYTELAPFFTTNLICEIDAMIMFAANATSYYSGVDTEIIYNILQGTVSSPFVAPLDCIESKLLFMSNQISVLVKSIIPGLLSASINSTSDTSTCNKTYQAITPYVGKLVTLMNNKGLIMTNATIDFQSISLDDLFLEALATVIDCLPNLIGKYVGAALNGNSASVTAYFNGNRSSLPYPFNCVKIVINILRSILSRALVNFATDSAANVVSAPKLPPYRG